MNIKRSPFFQKTFFLTLTLAAADSLHAGFQYSPQDVIVGVRKSGGTSELVVNAGSISNLLALTSGQSLTIANLTPAQLNAAFPDLNDLSFSISADVRTDGNPAYPRNTLWVTRPRGDFNTQSDAWLRKSQSNQGTTAGKISGVGDNAAAYGGQQPTDANNTSTGIVIPINSTTTPYLYTTFIGSGDFSGTFQGNVETTTASDFDTAGQSMRADLYQLLPAPFGTSLSATYLGFFEFGTNGVLTYKAGPSSVVIPQPNIVSVVRNAGVTTVTFTTVSGANYSLLGSSDLSLPLASWSVIGSPVAGGGSNQFIQDATPGGQKFYIIKATP